MQQWLSEAISNHYLIIVLLTFLPFLELRASIPYGILVAEQPWWEVFVLAAVVNIILGPIIYFLLDKLLHVFLHIGLVRRFWDRTIVRTQKRIHPMVEKYGVLGLGLFIGVPLPGSGVYSGAFGGYILGFTRKEFYIATVVGVLIAAFVVTAVVLTGVNTLDIFVKKA